MKKYLFLIAIVFAVFSVKAQEKTFTTEALNDVFLTTDETEITFFEILDIHKGKTIHLVEIKVEDDRGRLISICKITNYILAK